LGGHGYVREWGIEQIVRDARVAMIYEGTNEIQAIDLLVRKVLADGGRGMNTLLDSLNTAQRPTPPAALQRQQRLREITQQIVQAAPRDAALPYRVADDYLRAVGLVLMDWAWHGIQAALTDDMADGATRWRAPAAALQHWVLPEFDMRCAIMAAQCQAV
jgi:hypothetical protein